MKERDERIIYVEHNAAMHIGYFSMLYHAVSSGITSQKGITSIHS